MTELREGLPELPARFRSLPIDARGYPIPWFVITMPDGTRDFRIADSKKRVNAVKHDLCWLCGDKLGNYKCFVIGPMCAVNRNTSEPPCHRECAEFAVTACPFLMLPDAKYRTAKLPEQIGHHYGALPGNPGVTCIWTTKSYKPYAVPDGGWLIRIWDPIEVSWWAEGRLATRQEILQCMEARLPFLANMAAEEGVAAQEELANCIKQTMQLLPL